MSDTPIRSDYKPRGWPTVIPRIVSRGSQQQVEFLRRVFGATGELHPDSPAIVTIGDSRIMISDVDVRDETPAFLYVYVDDTDQTYQRAVEAGATSLEPPADMPYGDRRCMVKDAWGNIWQIATHKAGM